MNKLSKEIIAKCGFRCDLCPAYRENIHSFEDKQRVSDGWFKYFGFRLEPEKIYCDGCISNAENYITLDSNCPVRPCAIDRGFQNCAECSEYLCENLKSRATAYLGVIEKFKGQIPNDEYDILIKPFEGDKNLDKIRAKIGK
jgi:hypothetical protein